MRHHFIVEAWTNEPIKAEVELQNAIDLHKSLIGINVKAAGHSTPSYIEPIKIGNDPQGDPWRFHVECNTNNPDWTRNEIQKAINRFPAAAYFGLTIRRTVLLSEEPVSDVVEKWLRNNQRGRRQ